MAISVSAFVGKTFVSKVTQGMWARLEQTEDGSEIVVRVGLVRDVVEFVGMIEFVRVLPRGRLVTRGYPFGSVEHGMRVMLLRSPVSGWIVEVNEKLREEPELINEDPYGEGWIAVFRPINYEEDIKYFSELTK
ncbi:MAG: glycine cleavage system protein H [Nitrososphaerota archaeon]